MDEFDYSPDARDVLNKFHGVNTVLYVEGEDDIPFWELVFEKMGASVEVIDVGGKQELKKYMEKVSATTNCLVAIDSDYDQVGEVLASRGVIWTYGYSIENTVINEQSLHMVIRDLSRKAKKQIPDDIAAVWISQLDSIIQGLVVLDYVSQKEKLGIAVIPENCDQFLVSKKSYALCDDKIKKHVEKVSVKIAPEKIQPAKSHLDKCGRKYCEILRGHFLFSAATKFVKFYVGQIGRDVNLPKDIFFSTLIAAFRSVFNENHPHFEFYKRQLHHRVGM